MCSPKTRLEVVLGHSRLASGDAMVVLQCPSQDFHFSQGSSSRSRDSRQVSPARCQTRTPRGLQLESELRQVRARDQNDVDQSELRTASHATIPLLTVSERDNMDRQVEWARNSQRRCLARERPHKGCRRDRHWAAEPNQSRRPRNG